MLPIGIKVFHPGHGEGEVIAHSTEKENSYFKEKTGSACELASMAGLLSALALSIYGGDRYPNIIKFKSGYKDVYADGELTVIN